MIKVTVSRKKGYTSIINEMVRLGPRVIRAMQAVGEKILEDSRNLVPKDTRMLLSSSRTYTTGVWPSLVIVVGYGDPDVFGPEYSEHEKRYVFRVPYYYAKPVHENAQNHTFVDGQQDYLRQPCGDLPGLRTVLHAALGI